MVVVTDENLHRIVEYDRLDNTATGVDAHEPRRVIGGVNTHSEMMCGVYIDPDTLEIYVTQNDTVNWLPVFGREARGNVSPDRQLATPHRTFGIAADEVRDEMYVTIQSPAAVVVYDKSAEGDDAPLRFLEGDATELADPHGIYVDTVNNVVVVANHGNRTFYGGTGEAVSGIEGTWQGWIASNGFPIQTACEVSHAVATARSGGGSTCRRSTSTPSGERQHGAAAADPGAADAAELAESRGGPRGAGRGLRGQRRRRLGPGVPAVGQRRRGADAGDQRTADGADEPDRNRRRRRERRGVGGEHGQLQGDGLSDRRQRGRAAEPDDPRGPGGEGVADDRQPGGGRLRHAAEPDSGTQLSGASADCGICQVGRWRRGAGS